MIAFRGGELTVMMALDAVGVRNQVRVVSIEGGHGVRAHLNTLGIHMGDWLRVVERAPFRGPILVEVHGSRVALGRGVAAKVMVESDGEVRSLTRAGEIAGAETS